MKIYNLWDRVNRSDSDECWVWAGPMDKDGYGMFRAFGEQRVHRAAWVNFNGPIPKGMQVLHRCDNPPCCNPGHLFLGTGADNMRDKASKGRCNPPYGERTSLAKLTGTQVIIIRTLHAEGWTQRSIAKIFGVGYRAINKIVLRQRWKHL